MGFFSYTCAKSNLPALASTSWDDHPFTQVVLINKDGIVAEGAYDGYGRIFGREDEDVFEMNDGGFFGFIENGKMKFVLKSHYDPNDSFDSIGKSNDDPGQGHFHNEDFIEACRVVGGFSSYEDYKAAYEHFADFAEENDGEDMTADDLLAWKAEREASRRAGPAA